MTGTQNHEGIAGVKAALDYLADVAGPQPTATYRQRLLAGMQAIRAYETDQRGSPFCYSDWRPGRVSRYMASPT